VVLVPVPWEATVSYGHGTSGGPEAIRAASEQVDLFDLETGRPYLAGIAMLVADPELRDASDRAARLVARVIEEQTPSAGPAPSVPSGISPRCAEVNELSRWAHDRVRATVDEWLRRDKLVGVVGGDHSTAFGSIAAHATQRPGVGVLQFDAHADLRVAYQGFELSHASVMHQVLAELPGVRKLVSVGVRDLCEQEHESIDRSRGRVTAYFGPELARRACEGEPFRRVAQEIAAQLPDEVYVSFDIDGLDPALCPHTGTPVPGGLSFEKASAILDAVVQSGRRIVGFDLCEVAPGPDGDEWDANVGARILYKLIGYALASRA
jgi:agmatinase